MKTYMKSEIALLVLLVLSGMLLVLVVISGFQENGQSQQDYPKHSQPVLINQEPFKPVSRARSLVSRPISH